MRLSSLLTGILLPLSALAAKKPSGDRFADYRSKPTPVKLDDKSYTKLTAAPRDFSVAVLLTAGESRYGCQLCQEFQPEWELLAKSWSRGDKSGEGRLIFGTLDFTDGRQVFQSVREFPFCLMEENNTTISIVIRLAPLFRCVLRQLFFGHIYTPDCISYSVEIDAKSGSAESPNCPYPPGLWPNYWTKRKGRCWSHQI